MLKQDTETARNWVDNDKEKRLAAEPVGKLFISLAIPAIISQIVNLLYSVVDRMYVGHMPETGTLALTALGVCVPVITLISSFAQLVSCGAAPLSSIRLGGGKKADAEEILGNSFAAMLIMAAVLTTILLCFTEPILAVFGASDATMPYAMGVRGSALATVISQALSAGWALRFFLKHLGILELRIEYLRLKTSIILPALALGMAPFIMFSTESVLFMAYNSALLKYGGDLAVGMITIMGTLMQFLMLPAQGLAQGAQPIISYNYGAGNMRRVKNTFKCLISSAFIVTLVIYSVFMLAPRLVILPFTSSMELTELTTWGIRIYLSAGILIGIQMASLQTLMALGKAGTSTFLSLLRKVFLLIPFIYILPHLMKDQVFAVVFSEPLADVLSVSATLVIFRVQFRKTLSKDKYTKNGYDQQRQPVHEHTIRQSIS